MDIIFALNGLGYLAASLIAFYMSYSFRRKGEIACKVGNILGVNGIFYLLMSFLNFLWVFGLLEPNNKDFVLINSIVTVVSSVLILYAVYNITCRRNLVYLLVLFISAVFAINFSIKAFFIATLGVSYLLMAITFLELVYFSNSYLRWAGYTGLSYAAASILLLALTVIGREAHSLFWFIPATLMFFVFLLIYLDVANLGIIKREKIKQRKKILIFAYANVLVKFLIFIATISAFILVSTVAMHELGHALIAQYYGCGQFKAVIYDIIAPHTEIRCESAYNNTVLTLGGLAATLVIALLFILTSGQFTAGLSYLIVGFGLLISYGDLTDLGVSKNIIAVGMFLSLIIIIFAVIKISFYYLKQQDIFKDGIKDGMKRLADGEPEVKKILDYGAKPN